MIVVTGGAGFIGSALIWELNHLSFSDILVVDHLGESEKWHNLVNLKFADYLSREEFHNLLLANRLPEDISAIVHLGACSSTTERNADFLMQNNFKYSQDICRYALDKKIRIIVASSAATYGDGRLGFSDDPALIPKLKPLNMYGYSKQLLDLWLLRHNYQGQVCSLKFFNVYGPNEYHKGDMQSVVSKAYRQIKQNGHLKLFDSNDPKILAGEQKRDFVYVKDCVTLMAYLLEHPKINGIYNVGTGVARTFKDLGLAVFRALDAEPQIDYIPMPKELSAKYQNYTCADMSWLKTIDYPGKFGTLEEGVTDYVKNYLSQPDPYLEP